MQLTNAEAAKHQPHSSFTSTQKHQIIALAGSSTLVSPLAATMYLPLLPLLSLRFNVSQQAINLTITVYIICQAISPLFLAAVSDTFGRRPIYLATFFLFTMASIGLALNTSSYAALILLRAIQSFGASAVLSVNYGTVADICTTAERGKMLGPLLAAGNLGTCVGPIVGGWIALGSGGFRWAFWALAIFGGIEFVLLASLLPETARKVVGDGSVVDRKWNRPLVSILKPHIPAEGLASGQKRTAKQPARSLEFRSPLAALRLMFHLDTALILWLSSSSYALWYCVQASIPSLYKTPAYYSFNELQVGLAYLPGSVGVIISMFLTGKIMDRNYALIAKRSTKSLVTT
jgi:multidrug resistance protein